MRDYTRVALHNVEVAAAVGFYDWEHAEGRKTRLVVSVDLFSSKVEWKEGNLGDIIDYDRVHDYISRWADAPATKALETLANRLIDFCFEDARVVRCRACISKPDVIASGIPMVEIERGRDVETAGSPTCSE